MDSSPKMDEIIVPHSPKWFLISSIICAPDNGLLYASSFTVVYISPLEKKSQPRLKIFNVKRRIKSIACDPDWSNTKYFTVLTETNHLLVFDLNHDEPIKGHRCHANKSDHEIDESGAICFTTNKRIYSVDKNVFVNYCVLSNTFVVEKEPFNLIRNRVSIIKASPKNPSIFAVGTKRGLIKICNLDNSSVIHQLRGHDTEITSLDWILINNLKNNVNTNDLDLNPSTSSKLDSSDIFDIYSFDDLENEFGTIRDTKQVVYSENIIETKEIANENFNFVEACEMLKEDIVTSKDQDATSQEKNPTADEIKLQYNLSSTKKNDSDSDSLTIPSGGKSSPDFNDFVEETEKLKDFELIEKDEIQHTSDLDNLYLASGAREAVIWLWDACKGIAIEKIQLKQTTTKNSPLPSIFTVASWYDENTLISNNPNGELTAWMISDLTTKRIKIKPKLTKFSAKSVIGLCTNRKNSLSDKPFVWSFSIQRELICTQIENEIPTDLVNFSTLCPNINYIAECPMDLNKIAIGCVDRRIGITNVSNIKATSIPIQPLMNKIQSKVLGLAWHPIKENILAFSTSEGQIAIYDTTKSSNVPIKIKPFSSKSVYSIAWGNLTTPNQPSRLVLFACGGNGFVYIPECGENKYNPQFIKELPIITATTVCGSILAAGSKDGIFYMCDLNDNLTITFQLKISKKYISSINFNPINKNLIAISSMENDILILDKNKLDDKKKLIGHTGGVSSVHWSYNSLNKLVSASFDHTVRVWDTNTLETFSCFRYDNLMFAAIFSPIDDNFIICGGNETTLEIFDTTLHKDHLIKKFEIKVTKNQKTDAIYNSVIWAQKFQSALSMDTKKTKRNSKDRKIENLENEIDKNNTTLMQLTEDMKNITVKEALVTDKLKFHNTICYLINKEMNRDVVETIFKLLNFNKNDQEKCNILHKKIFSDRSDVEQVLQEELKNIKSTSATSPGNFIIPNLLSNLKEEIIERIEKKILSEEFIALSPFISYEFWKITCKAYAHQCIEKGFALNAIPYLIACHEINDCIEALFKTNNYREAWIICKLYKDSDDPIFKDVFDRWTKHLEYCGNYLGLSMIYLCNENCSKALEALQKIKIPNEEINQMIGMIKKKI